MLVAAQLGLLVFIVAVGGWNARIAGSVLMLGGFGLGAWAVATMGVVNVSPLPEVRAGASLIRRGPYRRLRHPMYTAILMIAAGQIANHPGLRMIIPAVALAVVLVVKVRREERFLGQAFADYAAYREQTWGLVPFIW